MLSEEVKENPERGGILVKLLSCLFPGLSHIPQVSCEQWGTLSSPQLSTQHPELWCMTHRHLTHAACVGRCSRAESSEVVSVVESRVGVLLVRSRKCSLSGVHIGGHDLKSLSSFSYPCSGIINPIEAKQRKGKGAVGAYGSERTTQSLQDFPVVDSEEEAEEVMRGCGWVARGLDHSTQLLHMGCAG